MVASAPSLETRVAREKRDSAVAEFEVVKELMVGQGSELQVKAVRRDDQAERWAAEELGPDQPGETRDRREHHPGGPERRRRQEGEMLRYSCETARFRANVFTQRGSI